MKAQGHMHRLQMTSGLPTKNQERLAMGRFQFLADHAAQIEAARQHNQGVKTRQVRRYSARVAAKIERRAARVKAQAKR